MEDLGEASSGLSCSHTARWRGERSATRPVTTKKIRLLQSEVRRTDHTVTDIIDITSAGKLLTCSDLGRTQLGSQLVQHAIDVFMTIETTK